MSSPYVSRYVNNNLSNKYKAAIRENNRVLIGTLLWEKWLYLKEKTVFEQLTTLEMSSSFCLRMPWTSCSSPGAATMDMVPESAWQHDTDASARGGGDGRVSAIETDTKLFITNLYFNVSTEDVKNAFAVSCSSGTLSELFFL